MYKRLLHQCIRLFSVIGCLILIYFTFKYTILFFYPFLIALLLSFIINPSVTYLETKLRFPRIFATFTVICMLFILISSISVFILTELIQGTTYLAIKIPAHIQTFLSYIDTLLTDKLVPLYHKLTSFIHTLNQAQQSTINDYIQQFISQISTSGTTLLKQILLKIPAILSMIPYSISVFIFTIIATFLITNDWYALKQISRKAIPDQLKYPTRNLLKHLGQALIGFFKAQFILISVSACIAMIGLLFLNVHHALTITLLIAVVDLLPLLGTGIIFIPWICYLFLTGNYALTIGLTILYMLMVISRQILEPKILAVNIGINPLVALLTVFISIQFWGLSGLLIAPLLLILVNACYKSGMISQIWLFIRG